MKNNYLFDFADKLDCLISEINKLNAKVRLYRKNSSKFNFDFNVKFTISPDCFENLRNYLYEKIEEGSVYNKKIVDLKREFAKEYLYLIFKIKQEIRRIEDFQEKEMNRIVYQKIYAAKYEFELKQINRYRKKIKKACFTINIQKTRGYKKKAQQEICYIAQRRVFTTDYYSIICN